MKTKTSRKYIRTCNHVTTIVANHFLLISGYRDVENVRFETLDAFALSPEEPLCHKLIAEFERLGLNEGTDYIIQDRTTHDGLWAFTPKSIKAAHTVNRVLEINSHLVVDENFRIELDEEYQFPADSELFTLLMEAFYEHRYVENVHYNIVPKKYPKRQHF